MFVVDGPVASSAGITAGIDLALHLIAGECGEALAASVAEDMVVYLRRSLRDPELSPFLAHRRHMHAAVHRVQDAISAEPDRDWDMPAMAAVGHVTERHLLRLFVQHAGVSPLHFCRSSGWSARASRSSTARASRTQRRSRASARACTCAARGTGNGAARLAMPNDCAGSRPDLNLLSRRKPGMPDTPPSTVPRLLEWRAREQPDQCAIEFVGGETWAFAELHARSLAMAAALQALGVGRATSC